MSAPYTAVILAGQRPGADPLATHFGEKWKALVPVCGVAMLTHVLRTLDASANIARIIIVAQQADIFDDAIADAACAKAVGCFVGNQGISSSLLALLDAGPDGGGADFPLLVTTADHPLLTVDMVAQFLGDVGDADLAVAMVERRVMLAQFPAAQRTWLRFADGAWSGANLFALTRPAARAALTLWQAAEADRKRPWRLFRHFGWGLALRAITRTIGLADGLKLAGGRLAMQAKLVPMVDPVAAIDVDKPADHALAEMLLLRKEVA